MLGGIGTVNTTATTSNPESTETEAVPEEAEGEQKRKPGRPRKNANE